MSHSVRASLTIAAIAASAYGFPAVAAQALGPTPATTASAPSTQQIYDYAMALAEIQQIRKSVADAPENQRPLLAAQAQSAIAAALDRRGLDAARFNEISALVEHKSALRHEVRQIMMRNALGV